MSRFEDELEQRLVNRREFEQNQATQAAFSAKKEKLLLSIKDAIYSILNTVSNKFKNAKPIPTHEINAQGEAIYKIGVGSNCFIDFSQDRTYGFVQSYRVGYQIIMQDVDTKNISIAIAYTQDIVNYRPILDLLKAKIDQQDFVYSGVLDEKELKDSVEKSILETIDAVTK